MKICYPGGPVDLKEFSYSRTFYQKKPGNEAEHGTFFFKGKKFLVEFVRFFSEGLEDAAWVVSKVSAYTNSHEHPELVYHFIEEKMTSANSKRNAFLIIINKVPVFAICDAMMGVIKVYELDDLTQGVFLKIGNEGMRFHPKSYERMLKLKVAASIILQKEYTLLLHEESKQQYDFMTKFFADNHLSEKLR